MKKIAIVFLYVFFVPNTVAALVKSTSDKVYIGDYVLFEECIYQIGGHSWTTKRWDGCNRDGGAKLDTIYSWDKTQTFDSSFCDFNVRNLFIIRTSVSVNNGSCNPDTQYLALWSSASRKCENDVPGLITQCGGIKYVDFSNYDADTCTGATCLDKCADEKISKESECGGLDNIAYFDDTKCTGSCKSNNLGGPPSECQ